MSCAGVKTPNSRAQEHPAPETHVDADSQAPWQIPGPSGPALADHPALPRHRDLVLTFVGKPLWAAESSLDGMPNDLSPVELPNLLSVVQHHSYRSCQTSRSDVRHSPSARARPLGLCHLLMHPNPRCQCPNPGSRVHLPSSKAHG
jgi:hypothetical protein